MQIIGVARKIPQEPLGIMVVRFRGVVVDFSSVGLAGRLR